MGLQCVDDLVDGAAELLELACEGDPLDVGRREGVIAARGAGRRTENTAALVDELGLELPMPASDFAIVLLALSNGLGVETDIDPRGVPDDLLARVLTLIVGDAVAEVQRAAARAGQ